MALGSWPSSVVTVAMPACILLLLATTHFILSGATGEENGTRTSPHYEQCWKILENLCEKNGSEPCTELVRLCGVLLRDHIKEAHHPDSEKCPENATSSDNNLSKDFEELKKFPGDQSSSTTPTTANNWKKFMDRPSANLKTAGNTTTPSVKLSAEPPTTPTPSTIQDPLPPQSTQKPPQTTSATPSQPLKTTTASSSNNSTELLHAAAPELIQAVKQVAPSSSLIGKPQVTPFPLKETPKKIADSGNYPTVPTSKPVFQKQPLKTTRYPVLFPEESNEASVSVAADDDDITKQTVPKTPTDVPKSDHVSQNKAPEPSNIPNATLTYESPKTTPPTEELQIPPNGPAVPSEGDSASASADELTDVEGPIDITDGPSSTLTIELPTSGEEHEELDSRRSAGDLRGMLPVNQAITYPNPLEKRTSYRQVKRPPDNYMASVLEYRFSFLESKEDLIIEWLASNEVAFKDFLRYWKNAILQKMRQTVPVYSMRKPKY